MNLTNSLPKTFHYPRENHLFYTSRIRLMLLSTEDGSEFKVVMTESLSVDRFLGYSKTLCLKCGGYVASNKFGMLSGIVNNYGNLMRRPRPISRL
jgi:hypothetical protein